MTTCIYECVFYLGQPDRAIQMLLQTDTGAEGSYSDALRACLIAALHSPETALHTIKVVAYAVSQAQLFLIW